MATTKDMLQEFASEHPGEVIDLTDAAEAIGRGPGSVRDAAKALRLTVKRGQITFKGGGSRKAAGVRKSVATDVKRGIPVPGDMLEVTEVHLTKDGTTFVAEAPDGASVELSG